MAILIEQVVEAVEDEQEPAERDELRLIRDVYKRLLDLDQPGQRRVLGYLVSRCGVGEVVDWES